MDVTPVAPAVPSAERDLQSVDASSWPEREFPSGIAGRTAGVVAVVIRQSILNHIHLHGQQTNDVEICGVLIGRGYRDNDGPFIYIQGAIRGDHAESQVAQVTFTAETWNHIYAIADTAWPEQRILGWYHTHPGFGIFLSGMDLFIHDNFFNAPEQFAIVYDPLSGEQGIFLWTAGKAVRAAYLVEPDEPEDPPQRPGRKLASATAGAGQQPDDLAAEVNRLRSNQTFLTFMLFAVALLAVVWPWVLFRWIIVPNLPALSPPASELERPAVKRPAQPKTNRPETSVKKPAKKDEKSADKQADEPAKGKAEPEIKTTTPEVKKPAAGEPPAIEKPGIEQLPKAPDES